MGTPRRLLQFIGANEGVVLEFFVTFSRFECALKRARFVKGDKHGNAHPDWEKFVRKVARRLGEITGGEFIKAKSYLLQNPPLKQVFRKPDKGVRWEENCKRDGESEGEYLLRLVRAVRNNLFHGGKYEYSVVIDDHALRNNELLKASLTVLEMCLELEPTLAFYFRETE
jgi:hypothetical protein